MWHKVDSAACSLAGEYLKAQQPQRWAHTVMVAAEAHRLAQLLLPDQADVVHAAAWLHDIGYAQPLVATGFHPLDGAALVRRIGFPQPVAELVAHHTGAETEAAQRGLASELAEYERPPQPWLSVVSCADLCTGPRGEVLEPAARVGDILRCYAPEHPVQRALATSGPDLIADARAILEQADHVERSRPEAPEDCSPGVKRIKSAARLHGWRIVEDYSGRCTFASGLTEVSIRWPASGAIAEFPVVEYATLSDSTTSAVLIAHPVSSSSASGSTAEDQIATLTECFSQYSVASRRAAEQ